jgi:ABC-type transport system involved in cytochrome c biogenesis permease subunit
LSYRIIGLGFPFLTIGIILVRFGQMKHGELIGVGILRNVGIDHMVSAIYLHSRLLKGWQGQKPLL